MHNPSRFSWCFKQQLIWVFWRAICTHHKHANPSMKGSDHFEHPQQWSLFRLGKQLSWQSSSWSWFPSWWLQMWGQLYVWQSLLHLARHQGIIHAYSPIFKWVYLLTMLSMFKSILNFTNLVSKVLSLGTCNMCVCPSHSLTSKCTTKCKFQSFCSNFICLYQITSRIEFCFTSTCSQHTYNWGWWKCWFQCRGWGLLVLAWSTPKSRSKTSN